jgi:ribosome biogenesis GTPase
VTSATDPHLVPLGWSSFFAEHFIPHADQGLTPARVALEYNRFYRLYAASGELTAELAGRVRHQASNRSELPAVGDWVAVRVRPDEETATIQAVLPRESRFSRKVAGRVADEQVVAANVDTVFLVSALDNELNPRRIERYLTVAWESGAQPVVLLNKADLAANADAMRDEIQSVAGAVPVHAVSSRYGDGIEVLTRYLRPGETIALLGSSGVGKSTLINRLLGADQLKTGDVRSGDSKGRHTTIHRELILLPGGSILMDTPGMREIQLWDASEGLQTSFADVEEFAEICFFPNCGHQNEPGCAVREAVEEGRLDPERVESYLKLQQELHHLALRQDHRAQHAERQRVKSITRLANRHQPRR